MPEAQATPPDAPAPPGVQQLTLVLTLTLVPTTGQEITLAEIEKAVERVPGVLWAYLDTNPKESER